jgi:hypothetical protein
MNGCRRQQLLMPLIAACLCVSLAPLSHAQAAGNLMKNPGFEDGLSATYPGVGLHWETNDAQPHSDVDVLTGSISHSGAYSQWLKANPSWDLGAVRQVSAYGSVTAGKTYHVQAWIKTANVANPAGWYVFGIWWFNNDSLVDPPAGESKMPRQETNNYDWRPISWEVVAPATANRVAAFLTRHTDGDAWYDDVFVGEVLPGAPQIAVSPASLSHRVIRTGSLANDSLGIRNAGGGLLSYVVSSGASWLSVASASGTNAGEADTCSLSYNLVGMPLGTFTTSLTVTDPAATNSPQIVPVSLTIYQPGDCDGDGDVDQNDFGVIQSCQTGLDVPQPAPGCACALMDTDSDVDTADLDLWMQCLSGPGVPASLDCAR